MKIEYVGHRAHGRTMTAGDIPVGTVFSSGEYKALLKAYNGVVNLETPSNTWSDRDAIFKDVTYITAKVVIE